MSFIKTEGSFPSSSGDVNIKYHIYKPSGANPKAIIQFVHGMCEFAERYEHFFDIMTERGYIVCGADNIGHGASVNDDSDFGYMGKTPVETLVNDVELMRAEMRKKYRNLPYIIVGHSLGAFIVQRYATEYPSSADGICISGVNGGERPLGLGILLCTLSEIFFGKRHRSKLIYGLVFKNFNKKFKHENDIGAWISKNRETHEKYMSDPRCRFIYPVSGFKAIFGLLKEISGEEWAFSYPKSLPLLILTGDDDPVGNYGTGAQMICNRLTDAEFENLSLRKYPNCRHELFNETEEDLQKVCDDIDSWADTVIDGVIEMRSYANTLASFGKSFSDK